MSLVGTWDLESSENFDEYMKEIGIFVEIQEKSNFIHLSLFT